MRSPVESVKGRIVGFDHKTEEYLIRAPCPGIQVMTKWQPKVCWVQFEDSRQLSDQQRKACYALIGAISEYGGMSKGRTKELMKIKFMVDEMEQTADKMFSLSNAPMSLVCAFQRFLVQFILEWDIPTDFPLLDMVDDVQDYIYGCLINKKCCICGRSAELHHHDRIGAGRNRDEIDQIGMLSQPLCREHHNEAHNIGQQTFDEKYHLVAIPIDTTLKRIWRLKGERKRYDGAEGRYGNSSSAGTK